MNECPQCGDWVDQASHSCRYPPRKERMMERILEQKFYLDYEHNGLRYRNGPYETFTEVATAYQEVSKRLDVRCTIVESRLTRTEKER